MNPIRSIKFWRALSNIFSVAAAAILFAWIRLSVAIQRCPSTPTPPSNTILYKNHGNSCYITPEQHHALAWFSTYMLPLFAILIGLAFISRAFGRWWCDDAWT